MTEDEEWEKRCEAEDKKEKRQELIMKVVVWGGIGLYGVYHYLNSSEHDQDVMGWILLGGLAFYNLEKKIISLHEKVDQIKNRLNL